MLESHSDITKEVESCSVPLVLSPGRPGDSQIARLQLLPRVIFIL